MAKLNPQVFMVNISSKALEYQYEHPNKSTEEIMKHIILSLDSEKDANLKIFGIAAANEILKMKTSFPQLTDKIFIINNGINPHLFNYDNKKIPNRFIYREAS